MFKSFKHHFSTNKDMKALIDNSFSGRIEELKIRPTLWKLCLGILPTTLSFSEWVSKTSIQRKDFYRKLKISTNKKLTGDPLGLDKGSVFQ